MRVTQKSFTGGELSPALYTRNELEKYSIGAKKIKNGFIHQEGSVSNRAGLEFIGEVKDSSKKCRLIPFSFNTEQTYIIELGNQYARFIKNGGYIVDDNNAIVEIVTPYLTDELFDIKYAQSADVLTLCHYNHPQAELSRKSHTEWELKSIDFKPSLNPPTGLKATWTGKSENPRTYTYLVTSVDDNAEESNRSDTVSVVGEYEANWATDEYITLSWSKVTGAVEYNIYRSVNGVFGYVGTATETTFTDTKIEPDLSSTAPISKSPFENGNYPTVVNYFQQRKIYANTKNNPQTIYASQVATSENFNISRPLVASDAITLTIFEREVNEIRNIVAMNDLIVFTSSAEWKINGSDGSFSASPPPQAKPQSYYGSSKVMPIVSGNMILFVQAGGSVLRDLGYTYVSDSYDGSELTIFANHLFEGRQIVDMAYAKEPFRIVWCVMSDGKLTGLTYNPKQSIAGWHRHETDGEFESIAVIREGFEDVCYFIVKREINGQTKRYVERMATRIIKKATDSIFLDSALKYSGIPVTKLSGLEHLEGKTVLCNADGGVIERVVKNGSINLDYEASIITVGLPYEFELETLNVEGENTIGVKKVINRLLIKIKDSREDFFIVGDDENNYVNPRSIESINDASLLLTTVIDSTVVANSTDEASMHIKQIHPLPLTILAMTAEVSIGDDHVQGRQG